MLSVEDGDTTETRISLADSISDAVKVKEADLYSAFIEVPYTQGAQVRITVLPANYTVPASTS